MQVIDVTNYKFERKFTDCDTYQFKITSELLEELENGQVSLIRILLTLIIIFLFKNVSAIELNIKGNTGVIFHLN